MSLYHKYFTILFFVSFAFNVGGQSNTDELKTLYYSINQRLADRNIDGIENSIDSLKFLSKKSNDTLYQFYARTLLASVYYSDEKFDLAEALLKENRLELKSIKPSTLKDSLLINDFSTYGHFYYRKDDYPNAVKNYIDKLKISKKVNDSIAIQDAYDYLGKISIQEKSYKKAINQFKDALNFTTTTFSKYKLYSSIGVAYYYLKDYENAEIHILKSTEYIDQTNKSDLYSSYTNLSGISLRNHKNDKAQDYILKAYEVSKKMNSNEKVSKALLNLSTFYRTTGNSEKCKMYMRKADSIGEFISSINYKKNLYLSLFKNYKNLKDYENALAFYEKHITYKDSLFTEKNKKDIVELHLAYKTELNQEKIESQEALIVSEENKNTWLLIGLGLLLTAMVFLFFVHRKRLSVQKMLLKKQEELAEEKINTVLEKEKVKTYQSHIEGQNKERKRISQELHDGVLGRLFGTRMALGFVQCKDEDVEKQKLFLDELQHIEADIRDVSHKINNEIEETELSFYNNINQLLKKTCFTGNFDFIFNASKDIEWESINELIRINLYRILQESLQNIIKHAQAKQVILEFTLSKGQLLMEIKDDGVGFSTTENSDGIGMKNIASRVEDINGTLNITSVKGKGTSLKITVPYDLVS